MEICLTMIVRNEAKIIQRCLRSAKPFINSWAICDTGSTDNTVEIIKNELENIPGILTRVGWRDFSYNRTLAFDLAKIQCKEKGYCLLLDADHEVIGQIPKLTLDSYLVNQHNHYTLYPNIRLIKSSLNWKCIGVTHEYWSGGTTQGQIDTFVINDHEDGGTRSEKIKRDEILLRKGLLEEPFNERYVFYLAQTLESVNPEEAIALYHQRASMGGYYEEAWMASYRAALLENRLDLAKVWEKAPHRAEALGGAAPK